ELGSQGGKLAQQRNRADFALHREIAGLDRARRDRDRELAGRDGLCRELTLSRRQRVAACNRLAPELGLRDGNRIVRPSIELLRQRCTSSVVRTNHISRSSRNTAFARWLRSISH